MRFRLAIFLGISSCIAAAQRPEVPRKCKFGCPVNLRGHRMCLFNGRCYYHMEFCSLAPPYCRNMNKKWPLDQVASVGTCDGLEPKCRSQWYL